MPRYELTMENNLVTDISVIDGEDEDEEILGIEWALSELRDTYNHSGTVSASFTLADETEVEELLDKIEFLIGKDQKCGVEAWRDFRLRTRPSEC